MLYSNKTVYLDKDFDRKSNDNDDNDKRSDPNLTYRVQQIKDYLLKKNAYRIPLSLIVDSGLVNFAIKTDTKIIITLERAMNKLFESNKKLAAIPANPDALINFHDRSYLFN